MAVESYSFKKSRTGGNKAGIYGKEKVEIKDIGQQIIR